MKKMFMCMCVLGMVAGLTVGCQNEDTKAVEGAEKDVKESTEAAAPEAPPAPPAPEAPKDHPAH